MFGMCIEEDPDTPTGGPADRDDDAGHSAQESGSSDAEDFKDNECPACEQAFGSQDKDRLWVTMFLHFSLCPLFFTFCWFTFCTFRLAFLPRLGLVSLFFLRNDIGILAFIYEWTHRLDS